MPRAKKPAVTEKIQSDVAKTRGPIKYNLELNTEQRQAKQLIIDNTITILTGKAGSGKTLAAIATALDLLFKKQIKKIYITRPMTVRTGSDMGYLPGDISDKMDPFLIPIYDNLNRLYNEETIKKLIESKAIDIAPIAFMRGRTIEDAVLIFDEAQNCDGESLKMCLTRIGKNGKIVLCGDTKQIDLKKYSDSGLDFLIHGCEKIQKMVHLDLKSNHRNEIVEEILKYYEDAEEKELQKIKGTKQLLRG